MIKIAFLKKGAMFGLDARIALAIFGALSVISGAALFSAIEQAQVQRVAQNYIEIGKAIESLMIDTGINYKANVSRSPCMLETNMYNMPGWKGPYFKLNNNYDTCTSNQTNDPLLNFISGGRVALGDQTSINSMSASINVAGQILQLISDNTNMSVCNKQFGNTLYKCFYGFRAQYGPSPYLTNPDAQRAQMVKMLEQIDLAIDGEISQVSGKFIYNLNVGSIVNIAYVINEIRE
tara:strand:+ start:550 stop:1254 length:705 start_codon:yes stop_codon:yes gene_type:complete